MIGNCIIVPYWPGLVMVKVPPERSSGDSCLERARPGQVDDLAGDGPQPLGLGVAQHRGEQALEVDVDGDAEVHVVVDDQLAVADRGVDVGEVADGVDQGPGDEGQVGEREALLGLPLGTVGPPHPLDASKSTSTAVSTWGEVCFDITMCSPVRLRMLLSGTDGVALAGAGQRRGAGGRGAAAAAGPALGAPGLGPGPQRPPAPVRPCRSRSPSARRSG
jgi:hypothetical protein